MKATAIQDKAAAEQRAIFVGILLGIAILILLVISFVVGKNIIRGIDLTKNSLKDFFDFLNNKTNSAHLLNIKGKDEISQMAALIDENIEKTKSMVELAHKNGLSIEAEVGSIGGEEDGVIGAGEVADPNECKKIADLGVDMLAAGIGNIHGKYPANWKGLSFETLEAINNLTGDMPLVLHGGTGIPSDMIKKAISLGVSKINVNTECQLSFAAATRKYIEAGKDLEGKGFDPRKLLKDGTDAIMATVKEKMELFGSVNKA